MTFMERLRGKPASQASNPPRGGTAVIPVTDPAPEPEQNPLLFRCAALGIETVADLNELADLADAGKQAKDRAIRELLSERATKYGPTAKTDDELKQQMALYANWPLSAIQQEIDALRGQRKDVWSHLDDEGNPAGAGGQQTQNEGDSPADFMETAPRKPGAKPTQGSLKELDEEVDRTLTRIGVKRNGAK